MARAKITTAEPAAPLEVSSRSAEMTTAEKLIAVQVELKAPKSQYNAFGKYSYRNQEDILESLKPLLFKYNLPVTISDAIHESAGMYVAVCATIRVGVGEDMIESKAYAGIDFNRKGMDLAQTFGSASSYARKYALNAMFLIDDTKDADATNTHGKGPTQALPPVSPIQQVTPPSPAPAQVAKTPFDAAFEYISASAQSDREGLIQSALKKYDSVFTQEQKDKIKSLL
jgi:hypothetical protein